MQNSLFVDGVVHLLTLAVGLVGGWVVPCAIASSVFFVSVSFSVGFFFLIGFINVSPYLERGIMEEVFLSLGFISLGILYFMVP